MQEKRTQQVETSQTSNKDRIYFSVLERVGTRGCYQYILIFVIFLIGMESSACFLVNPYLFYEQPFTCPQEISNCKQFVCGLPSDERSPYIPPPDGKSSLANQFGDHRCEGQQFVLLLNTSVILGSVIGIFSAIFFTQWLGRRWTMILSLVSAIIGLLLCLVPSKTMVIIGVFLYGAGLDISYSCIFTLITQFFAESDRGFFYNVITLAFATGNFLNPLAFYLINSWKFIVLAMFVFPILAAILGLIFFVQDTPIELFAYKQPEQILAAFLRIANLNKVTNHGLTLEAVKEIKEEYDENQRKKHSRVFSIIDIFRFKSLRVHIIPLGALKFVMMFIFYTPGILLSQFAMNIYINGFVNGLSQLCGIPMQLWLLKYPRKDVTYLLFASSAVFAVSMFISKELCTSCIAGETSISQGVFLFLYRICCTVVSFIVVVMLNQTYPAQVRNLAIFINISFGRSSAILIPFVSRFCDFTHIPFLILLACCSVLGIGVTCFTEETFGINPPQMIKEVEIQRHNYKYYSIEAKPQFIDKEF